MKKLALFLAAILLTSVAAFTFGRNGAAAPENYVSTTHLTHDLHLSSDPKCDKKPDIVEKGVQFELEITGNDCDGYDLDAVNPTDKRFECTGEGVVKGDTGGDISIKTDKFVVSNTGHGRFNAYGKAGLGAKNLMIKSYSVSCTDISQ